MEIIETIKAAGHVTIRMSKDEALLLDSLLRYPSDRGYVKEYAKARETLKTVVSYTISDAVYSENDLRVHQDNVRSLERQEGHPILPVNEVELERFLAVAMRAWAIMPAKLNSGNRAELVFARTFRGEPGYVVKDEKPV